MKQIIEKLANLEKSENPFESWTMEDKKKLIELYLLISNNESKIFNFIFQFKNCDCFGNQYLQYLEDKSEGVIEVLDLMNTKMKNN